MNKDNFLIEDSIIEQCKDICGLVSDSTLRNKKVASAVVAKTVIGYFENLDVDVVSSLHNIPQILQDWEISDVYVNGAYIDVRFYFEEDNLFIPKYHFDKNLLPCAYMFVKVSEDFSDAFVTGFVLPTNVDLTKVYCEYYKVSEQDLVSYYDIESSLISPDSELPEDFETKLFDYVDGSNLIDEDFSRVLLSSKYARQKLIEASNVASVFNFVSIDSALEEQVFSKNKEFKVDASENDYNSNLGEELLVDLEPLEAVTLHADGEEVLVEDLSDIHEITESNLELTLDSEIYPEPEFLVDEQEFINTVNIDTEDDGKEGSLELDEEIQELENETETVSQDDVFETLVVEEDGVVEYPTTTTPSMDSIEQIFEDSEILDEQELQERQEEVLSLEEDVLNEIIDEEMLLDVNEEESKEELEQVGQNENEAIDDLFRPENLEENIEIESSGTEQVETRKNSILPIVGIITILGAISYYGFTKFSVSQPNHDVVNKVETATVDKNTRKKDKELPMPVETVENVKTELNNIEGNALSIPAIEQNLDASILVSNLSVNWEVPSAYANNNVAKRYLTKLGKIIQLHLKSELLLLSKPPITNKIVLDLEFNKSAQRFGVKSVSVSSGEKLVDDLIVQVVKKALDLNINTSMSVFNNMQGAPVLVIRL